MPSLRVPDWCCLPLLGERNPSKVPHLMFLDSYKCIVRMPNWQYLEWSTHLDVKWKSRTSSPSWLPARVAYIKSMTYRFKPNQKWKKQPTGAVGNSTKRYPLFSQICDNKWLRLRNCEIRDGKAAHSSISVTSQRKIAISCHPSYGLVRRMLVW